MVVIIALAAGARAPAAEAVRSGRVAYTVPGGEDQVAKRFRLAAHEFTFREEPVGKPTASIALSRVTFPSPVVTAHENNNTVHCEYFRPTAAGKDRKCPAVIVLHILGGDFALSRLFASALADSGTAALFLKMPYYGPRRQPGVSARMISTDPNETVAGMTQAVLDIRRGCAWLAAQEEIDEKQLGVFGISLGGITTALAASAEPRLVNVCPMLAGGDMTQVVWESPQLARTRAFWTAQGGTRRSLAKLIRQIDPVTYAGNVRGRRILMLNASHDEVIPKKCTDSLWKALGKPEIVWFDSGHYSAILYLPTGVSKVTAFFKAEEPAAKPKS
jgi:dienelactone hydrolase